jgi:predicted RNase H-like nuclease (RuvC/YqgF family)
MSIASEVAAQIEDLEEEIHSLNVQLEEKAREIEAFEHSLEALDADYDNFMAYAESVTPGIVLAYKAQKELTR